jgi:hypothetical protein
MLMLRLRELRNPWRLVFLLVIARIVEILAMLEASECLLKSTDWPHEKQSRNCFAVLEILHMFVTPKIRTRTNAVCCLKSKIAGLIFRALYLLQTTYKNIVIHGKNYL